jgi:HD-GYP domain-containing protein (c-di-GMP phosphodiesterase class II)
MTSDRPYRKALPLDCAISELKDNAGTQFDPAIIEIFADVIAGTAFFQSRFIAPTAMPAIAAQA